MTPFLEGYFFTLGRQFIITNIIKNLNCRITGKFGITGEKIPILNPKSPSLISQHYQHSQPHNGTNFTTGSRPICGHGQTLKIFLNFIDKEPDI